MKAKLKCLYPNCESTDRNVRGLCSNHYNMAHRLVKLGKTTWEELEKKGKTKPPTGKWGHGGEVTKHFLS